MDDNLGKPPTGATHLCELRPRDIGSGFEIVSRTRILSWRKDAAGDLLPITAFGVVDKRAFTPSTAHPEDGFCFIECRAPDRERQWVSPFRSSFRLTDAQVRGLLHNEPTHKIVPTKGPPRMSQATQPPRFDPPTLAQQRAMGMIRKHYATQAQQQQQRRTSTQQLRRELNALKKRYE